MSGPVVVLPEGESDAHSSERTAGGVQRVTPDGASCRRAALVPLATHRPHRSLALGVCACAAVRCAAMAMGATTEADRDLQARQMSAAAVAAPAAATTPNENNSPTAHAATLLSPSTAGRKHPRQADTEMDAQSGAAMPAASPHRTAADALPLSKAEHDAAVIKSEFVGVAPVPILPPMAPFAAEQLRAAKTESMDVGVSDCAAAAAAADVKSGAILPAACSPSTEFMPRASSANIAAMHTATAPPGSGHPAGSHQRSSSSSMLPSFGSLTYRLHAHPGHGHGHGHGHDMHEYEHGMQIAVHSDNGAMHSPYGVAMGQACAVPGGGALSTSDYIGGGLMDDGDDRSGGGSCHQVRTARDRAPCSS